MVPMAPLKGVPVNTLTSRPAVQISVVVIGRNEGERLSRCLRSLGSADWGGLAHEVIYVDSSSTDGSPVLAEAMGARVFGIGHARPCAAVGRNIGWRAARGRYILFLDGDTVLHSQFIRRALQVLEDKSVVAVWGHRRELNPGQSVYTRVLDLDWVCATGRVAYFGGDVLVRRQALADVGGFGDAQVAGEEHELCRRLRERGWQIEHIDAPMTGHDLAITTFAAYWKRAERAGLAYAQVAARFAGTSDPLWSAEVRRNRIHGGLLLALPLLLLVAALLQPLLALGLVAAVATLVLRSARRGQWKCPGNFRLALLYALHSHVRRVPILFGQWHWQRLARRQQAPTPQTRLGLPVPRIFTRLLQDDAAAARSAAGAVAVTPLGTTGSAS